MKQTIRLTESKLRRIIRDSVKKCLYEHDSYDGDDENEKPIKSTGSLIQDLDNADLYFVFPQSYSWPIIEEKYGSDEKFARNAANGTYFEYGGMGCPINRYDLCQLGDTMWRMLADDLSQKYKVDAEYDGNGHITVNGEWIGDEEELSKLRTESIRRRRRR